MAPVSNRKLVSFYVGEKHYSNENFSNWKAKLLVKNETEKFKKLVVVKMKIINVRHVFEIFC